MQFKYYENYKIIRLILITWLVIVLAGGTCLRCIRKEHDKRLEKKTRLFGDFFVLNFA